MRILIDMQGAQNGSRYRGIGRYSLAFAHALIRHRGRHEIILLLSDLFPESVMSMRAIFEPAIGREGVHIWSGLTSSYFLDPSNDWRRRTSELLREAFIATLSPDVVVVTSMFEGCGDDSVTSVNEFCSQNFNAAIFYDLIPLIYSEDYLADSRVRLWYEEKVRQLKKSDLLLAISKSTIEEGIRHIGLKCDALLNISAAVGPEFCPASYSDDYLRKFSKRFGLTRPFLMYSGATDPRKNVRSLIAAWSLLPPAIRAAHQLALVGGMPSDHRQTLERFARSKGIASSELVFSDRVDDSDLLTFYRICRAFILPSLHEGFGLPALEAMACGAPTIGSNFSSIPEVIGLQSAMFDPRSPEDISDHIARALTDDGFRQSLLENGKARASLFSWDQSASLALERFEQMQNCGGITPPLKQTSEARVERLVELISNIRGNEIADTDLLTCAEAIARMIPRSDARAFVYVDISELHRRDSRSGIQRVVRSLAKCFLGLSDKTRVFHLIYATEDQPYRHANAYMRMMLGDSDIVSEVGLDDDIIDFRSGDTFLGLDFQDQIVIAHAPYYRQLRRHGVRVCFVVYDLLPIMHPNFFSSAVRANYERWLEIVSEQDSAICISRTTATELTSWCRKQNGNKLLPLTIDWFHMGADVENSSPSKGLPIDADVHIQRIGATPSFLMVGTIEPRKGYEQVISAFETLWEQGANISLVIVGRQGWLVEDLVKRLRHHPQAGQHLFWIESASDEYVERLYQTSACLIAASFGEGFGLPLIEAARHELPLIVRDIPIFREVAGDHAFYFRGSTPVSLAAAIRHWLSMYVTNIHPGTREMPWSTWDQSANQLLRKIIPSENFQIDEVGSLPRN
jgi:glycosyltransferase involved in cell wall biosynthesis